MKDAIKIPGHSGSRVIVEIGESGEARVIKCSQSPRLINQSKKQINFFNTNAHSCIHTPKIFDANFNKEKNQYCLKMEYAHGIDIVSFFCEASVSEVDHFVNTLTSYFKKNIELSSSYVTANNEIIKKIKDVKIKLLQKKFKICADRGLSYINRNLAQGKMRLPRGICHGDLTYSNMVYNPHTKRICFFDFLDTYFESPVQDMIKIKQDTDFFWTKQLLIGKRQFDEKRYDIVNENVKTRIDEFFKKYDFFTSTYKVLQILNLLRIIVYSNDCKKVNYLLECIDRIIDE